MEGPQKEKGKNVMRAIMTGMLSVALLSRLVAINGRPELRRSRVGLMRVTPENIPPPRSVSFAMPEPTIAASTLSKIQTPTPSVVEAGGS
jgi:hypothetical protein